MAQGDHLAVLGVVLASRAMEHRTGSESYRQADYWLLPLVPSNWRAGQSARLVVKVENPSELPGYALDAPERPWALPQPLLVRVGAALPLTATSQFSKFGVPLAADHHVLHVVASLDGKPLQQDTDYLQITLWVCGVGSVAFFVMFAGSAWIVHRRDL